MLADAQQQPFQPLLKKIFAGHRFADNLHYVK